MKVQDKTWRGVTEARQNNPACRAGHWQQTEVPTFQPSDAQPRATHLSCPPTHTHTSRPWGPGKSVRRPEGEPQPRAPHGLEQTSQAEAGEVWRTRKEGLVVPAPLPWPLGIANFCFYRQILFSPRKLVMWSLQRNLLS